MTFKQQPRSYGSCLWYCIRCTVCNCQFSLSEWNRFPVKYCAIVVTLRTLLLCVLFPVSVGQLAIRTEDVSWGFLHRGSFPGGEAAEVWSWLLTCDSCRGQACLVMLRDSFNFFLPWNMLRSPLPLVKSNGYLEHFLEVNQSEHEADNIVPVSDV
jgi:hypothetical protein